LRLTFFGTSGFACPALETLAAAGHDLVAVVTQPRRPSGRGRKLQPGPVELTARHLELPLLLPEDPNDPGFADRLRALEPELGVLASYGRILRRGLLSVPARGFINIHPSLLPRYRGAAPVQRALMAGETETGVTVIRMATKVDAGDLLARRPVDVGPDETAGELLERLARLGAELVRGVIPGLAAGDLDPVPQDDALATPAPRLVETDRRLDWNLPAGELHNRIRGMAPTPGAVAGFRGRRLLVLRSQRTEGHSRAKPGTLLLDEPGLVVETGSGPLAITELRPQGGRTQSGAAFRNGQRPKPGENLESI